MARCEGAGFGGGFGVRLGRGFWGAIAGGLLFPLDAPAGRP
ncbi:hypothetical protein SAMN05216227_10054 [Pseudorhodobacter antarcticus]|uniref:Uncharacterized protein n=1 Tax=Pseudorhodobacter antarcticus TaxID=1077947 RepID=A0A1H8CHX3_9RHOB|nr:hypothetical protein SAMN05216227_10054 [Pseudorhodobacter antarcticus]